MRNLLLSAALVTLFAVRAFAAQPVYEPQNGDIIFHQSKSAQSKAIQQVTNSKYTHVGIVYRRNSKPYVFEAYDRVRLTPLNEWIDRGVDEHFVVKRLKEAKELLTRENLQKMKKVGESFEDQKYDPFFLSSDDRIYCSELVWKIYYQALGKRVGKWQKMKDFKLTHPEVAKIVKKRFPKGIPSEELVITPKAMFDSGLLEPVFQN